MGSPSRWSFVLILLAVGLPSSTLATPQSWRPIQGPGLAQAVTVDGAHNVVAVGETLIPDRDRDLVAVKIAPDGTQMWRTTISGSAGNSDGALSVATDADGDVFVGGYVDAANGNLFQILKLSGSDGSEVWRSPERGIAYHLKIADNGDLLVVGTAGGNRGIRVSRLSSVDGTEIWHTDAALGSDAPTGMALDPVGNIVISGYLGCCSNGQSFFVAKYLAVDGTEAWRYVYSTSVQEFAHDVAVDANGDVFAVGDFGVPESEGFSTFGVTKLDGDDGSEIWVRGFVGVANGGILQPAAARAVAVDQNGDVVAAGETVTPTDRGSNRDFVVRKLSGIDGAEIWTNFTTDIGRGTAYDVLVDEGGDAVAAGMVADPSVLGGSRVFVQRLDGATGHEEWRVLGRAGYVAALAIDGASGAILAAGVEDVHRSPEMLVAKIGFATGGACGDGIVTPGSEACDDANAAVGDGCDSLCRPEEAATVNAQAEVPVTTDTEMDGASANDPIETSVTASIDGPVTIIETSPTGDPTDGYAFLNYEIRVTAPDGTPENPLILTFQLDATAVPFGEDETTIAIFCNDVLVPACSGSPGEANPDPCVESRSRPSEGDVVFRIVSSRASRWNLAVASCIPAPPGVCRGAGLSGAASLQIQAGRQKRLIWRSGSGVDLPPSALGDPLTTGAFRLCVVSDAVAPPLKSWAHAPAGRMCGKRPCWKVTRKGLRYKNSSATPNGIDTLTLEGGSTPKAKFILKAKGENLMLPPFPISGQMPLRVQLQASNGDCWESTFTSSGISKEGVVRFDGRAE